MCIHTCNLNHSADGFKGAKMFWVFCFSAPFQDSRFVLFMTDNPGIHFQGIGTRQIWVLLSPEAQISKRFQPIRAQRAAHLNRALSVCGTRIHKWEKMRLDQHRRKKTLKKTFLRFIIFKSPCTLSLDMFALRITVTTLFCHLFICS